MSTSENPYNSFDTTIHDPIDPEGPAIEDPIHGPTAVAGLLAIPLMPLGDGTYYRAGGLYTQGTVYVDALDRPVHKIGGFRSTIAVMREVQDLGEWQEASEQGEYALTVLEATRQQKRMERNGVAHSFRPSDVCGGGKRLDDCETAIAMVDDAKAYADRISEDGNGGTGRVWNVPAWLGQACTSCALDCEVAIETQDGRPTGVTRFSNVSRDLPADSSTTN